MKHIQLYENFKDRLSSYTRDIFGLTSTIQIEKDWIIEGPLEYEEEATNIANGMIEKINGYPMAVSKHTSVWDSYLDYALKNWMSDELAALAQIGWEIKFRKG
jgi:hypothetical protein